MKEKVQEKVQEKDLTEALKSKLADANDKMQAYFIVGGGSKTFYGYGATEQAVPLEMSAHSGVIAYEPVELMIRVRSGTRLADVENSLRKEGQMLAFEPPSYSPESTMGGVVAAGLSGAARPYRGAIRDYVLGATILSGDGRHLEFGGQVMKNVAGYDVSRLMVGSMGTLGVILDISFKVLPLPEMEITLCMGLDQNAALRKMRELFGLSYPVTASLYHAGILSVRLSGKEVAVSAAAKKIGGETSENDIWSRANIQDFPEVKDCKNLWRLSTKPGCDSFLQEANIIEWGGGVRWLADPSINPRDGIVVQQETETHATLFRCGDKHEVNLSEEIFQPLPAPVMAIHQNLKKSFDPNGILNRGHMYRGL